MKTTESLEDVEIESHLIKAGRLTFLGSLLFWPLFVFAAASMLGPPGKSIAAGVERTMHLVGILVFLELDTAAICPIVGDKWLSLLRIVLFSSPTRSAMI